MGSWPHLPQAVVDRPSRSARRWCPATGRRSSSSRRVAGGGAPGSTSIGRKNVSSLTCALADRQAEAGIQQHAVPHQRMPLHRRIVLRRLLRVIDDDEIADDGARCPTRARQWPIAAHWPRRWCRRERPTPPCGRPAALPVSGRTAAVPVWRPRDRRVCRASGTAGFASTSAVAVPGRDARQHRDLAVVGAVRRVLAKRHHAAYRPQPPATSVRACHRSGC